MFISPILGRRSSRVEMVRQTESGECALAALAMIANYHGNPIGLAELRRRFRASSRGNTLEYLMHMAEAIGFSARPISIPLEGLAHIHLPAILHWNMNHFVVVERIRADRVLIHDPEGMSDWLPIEAVSRHFTGIALELRQVRQFDQAQPRRRLDPVKLLQGASGIRRSLFQILTLSIFLELYTLISPFYLRLAVDVVLPSRGLNLMTVLAIGFALLTATNVLTLLLRSLVIAFANAAVGHTLYVNVARKLLRLPIDWYERRHIGDVMSRLQSTAPIRQFLTENSIGAFIDGCLGALSLVVMLTYSLQLSMVAIGFLVMILIGKMAFLAPKQRAQETAIAMAGREQSVMMETLRGITTLRVLGGEDDRLQYWQRRLADSVTANLAVARVNVWQESVGTSLNALESVISIYLAIGLVLSADFSLGMVFAYMAYKTQFLRRTSSLLDQTIAFRMLRLHVDRLADIMLTDEDKAFDREAISARTLSGRIELRGVAFRYAPTDPYVLSGVDLVIEPGEHVAITGPSGEGKSTLIKIILGLIEPSEGAVFVDGIRLTDFGLKSYRAQVGAVLQNDGIFAGSIAENIALFDNASDMDRVIASAKAAALHDDIAAMPMVYETLVGDMGAAISGGQKQRLILARALYRQPRLLVVDEGTSHLDEDKERLVNAAISALGVTRIVVAHRRQTIASADRIIRLSDGKLGDVAHSAMEE